MNCDFLIKDEPACDPFLTIDGSLTDTTKGEQHSDGILIGSDRDVVRGLRIINFAGAGVGIKPICNLGFNRNERNRFENNKKAGVRVLDSPADPDPDVKKDFFNLVPPRLGEKLRNGNLLFLGYRLRGWNLRIILRRIWGEERFRSDSWAIEDGPVQDEQYWGKRNVEVLGLGLQDFVEEMEKRLNPVARVKGV